MIIVHPGRPLALTLRVEFAGFWPAQANSVGSSHWSWSTTGHRWHRAATSMTLFLPDGVSAAKPEPVGSIFLCISLLLLFAGVWEGYQLVFHEGDGDFGLGSSGCLSITSTFPLETELCCPL